MCYNRGAGAGDSGVSVLRRWFLRGATCVGARGERRLSGGAYRVAESTSRAAARPMKKRRREPGGKGFITSRYAAPWDIPRVGKDALRA